MDGQAAVTNGETTGTSGERPGTNGAFPWAAWGLLAALTAASLAVNVSSILMEVPPDARNFEAWEPLLWEGSSGVVLLALAPLVWRALRHVPIRPPWGRALLTHLALTIPFSVAHVLAMLAIRLVVYELAGGRYGYLDEGLARILVYEWRKDVLSYALQLGLFWGFARLRSARPAAAAGEPMLSLRTGGGTVHLRPSSIRIVEAAGNYVEIEADGRRHLVRATLGGMEAQLGPQFIRIHRSKLLNRALILRERPQPSGDVLLDLRDGGAILASRRFRDRLPSAGLRTVTNLP